MVVPVAPNLSHIMDSAQLYVDAVREAVFQSGETVFVPGHHE